MKILFAVDGSDCALAALDKFTSMPLVRDAPELILINVQPRFPYPRAAALVGKEVVAQYYEVQSEEELAGADLLSGSRSALVIRRRKSSNSRNWSDAS